MIRRPPRSTLDRSSAASDVYKRQVLDPIVTSSKQVEIQMEEEKNTVWLRPERHCEIPVSYTHLRAHETVLDLVCRLLLEKRKEMVSPTH